MTPNLILLEVRLRKELLNLEKLVESQYLSPFTIS